MATSTIAWTPRNQLICLLIVLIVLCFLIDGTFAFGAGNIPSFSFLEDKAFRHGDIEDSLAEMVKKGGGGMLGGLGAKKFGGLDIKRVYFGNWLRDYSQAMDIAGLSKLPKQTIINLCMALGFLAHGYATKEFEVTEERLGVYLPVEHIDNPKGYGEGQDARTIHPGLRPPVDDRELEIDPRTAMKNYIANESGGWDTSTACVRRNLLKCIEMGRKARTTGRDDDLYEAYRLLGTALHTLEDLAAHSNWCELSLKRLGYGQVFCHVGENVLVQTPSGLAPPLVTGTFGGADFIHSLLGEATDHISEASVSDLNRAMNTASRSAGNDPIGDNLREMLFQLPGGNGNNLSREMDNVSEIRSRAQPGSGYDPAQMSPQELHTVLWQILTFRDDVCKTIERTIERIPGLSSLVEKLTNAINTFVFTTLEPYLKPIMKTATAQLQQGSAAVIDQHDQYEVFTNPNASDPTHSILSKDHFALILNEPAGLIAKIIVRHTVRGVVNAWDNASVDPMKVVNVALEAFHHPYFVDGQSDVQREMGQFMKDWIGKMPHADKEYILNGLTKEAVRAGKNKRKGTKEDRPVGQGNFLGYQYQSVLPTPSQIGGRIGDFAGQAVSHVPGFSQAQHMFGSREMAGYGGRGPPESFSEPGAPYASYAGAGYSDPGPPAQPPFGASGGPPQFPTADIATPAGYGTPFPGSEAPLRNDSFDHEYNAGYNTQYNAPPPHGPGWGPPPPPAVQQPGWNVPQPAIAGGYQAEGQPPPAGPGWGPQPPSNRDAWNY